MDIRQLLNANRFKFNKAYGQNFLTDDNLLDEIVYSSGITGDDVVLEIGCGAGTLTRAISKVAKKVVAVEIDTNLKPILATTLADRDNVTVHFADVMSLDMPEIHELIGNCKYKIVANIPYYITSPLLMKFVENCPLVESLTLTIQKEVADRLCAKHGTKEYGAITVSVDIVADATTVMQLPRALFTPVPNVDSAVVNVVMNRNKHEIADMAHLKKVIKSAFAMRRKTLANNLMSAYALDRATAEGIITGLGIDSRIRGEQLGTIDFLALDKALTECNK